ncbi:MAG: DNA cytosine methyltransferase [Sphingobacteriia bacterium]|nr:DNA cytosine methyltransferase [Sphingobacteriia bacterium]
MIIIDLFSGAGGLTEGFLNIGVRAIAHIEKDAWACETLKTRLIYHRLKSTPDVNRYWEYCRQATVDDYENLRESLIYSLDPSIKQEVEQSVFNYTFGDTAIPIEGIIDRIKINLQNSCESKVSMIIGGPPCQAYSLAGRGRMKEKAALDDRNFLFRYYIQMVKEFQPDFFFMENVPGILTARNGEIFKAIREEFGDSEVGYDFFTGIESDNRKNILNAADFGVPQNRKRMLMLGVNRSISFDYKKFYLELAKYQSKGNRITTGEAISDLPILSPEEGSNNWLENYKTDNQIQLSEYQKRMRTDSMGVMNHFARFHNSNDLEIYKLVLNEAMKGKRLQYFNLPDERKTHKNHHSFTDRYKVHRKNELPHTIVAHIGKDGHYNIHYDIKQLRSITVREAARIQSFPDNYKFEGPRSAQYKQIGNAVPPIFSECVAKAIVAAYYESNGNNNS